MSQYKKFCFLGLCSLGVISFHEIAQAQFTPQFITPYYGKPEQIRPDLYGPNGSDPAPQFRSLKSSVSRPSLSASECEGISEDAYSYWLERKDESEYGSSEYQQAKSMMAYIRSKWTRCP